MDRLASGWRPPCDILELRVDLLGAGTPDWLQRAVELEAEGRPVLVTIRHPREGGHWYGTDVDRLDLYTRILPHVSAVDFEIRSPGFAELIRRAHAAGKPVVGSFHDFNALPSDAELRAVIAEGQAAGADIIKIAAVTQTESDLARMKAILAEQCGAPLCLLGMGAWGPRSRTDLPACGSCLTFGYVDEANAPGQLSSAELVDHLTRTLPAYRRA
jgi:3-dehydroquinate dehydratase-1